MALTDDQKIRAKELKELGMSNRSIAEAIGSSKDTVARYLKSIGPLAQTAPKPCAKNSPARTRANKVVAQNGADLRHGSAPDGASESSEPDRTAMATMAFDDVQTMRTTALRGLEAVSRIEDLKERTWMESTYLKILEKSTRMLGTWGGLDEITDKENEALTAFAEAMGRIESDTEGWEVR